VTYPVKTTTVMFAAAALFVVYFPIALWLKYSYVPPPGPAAIGLEANALS
jgi:hypothetical protein